MNNKINKIFRLKLAVLVFSLLFGIVFYSCDIYAEAGGEESDSKYIQSPVSLSCYYKGDVTSGTYEFGYYDDMLLEHNATEFSGDLAKVSVGLASAAYGKNNIKTVLNTMGFEDSDIITNGSYEREVSITSNDSVAYTIAMKKIGDYYIYVVPVRGTPQSAEWYSDFNLGETGNHAGFYTAAREVSGRLMEKIRQDGADKEHTIIWTMGHSRGAAVANIIAGELTDRQLYAKSNHIFCYTYACPAVSKTANTTYTNIYNFNYSGDLITELPLEQWGYRRYGKTIDTMNSTLFDNGLSEDDVFDNECLQFKRITGKDFVASESTSSYINALMLRPSQLDM